MTNKITEEVRVEYMPLSELASATRNPKQHDTAGIKASLVRFGFTIPAALNETTGRLVAGHGRLGGCRELKAVFDDDPVNNILPKRVKLREDGEWLVPVLRGLSFENEQEAEAYLLADNRLSELGGWDEEQLQTMLKDISLIAGLDGVGFTDSEIEEISQQVEGAADVGDSTAEARETYEAGEVKQVVLYFDGAQYEKVIERMDNAKLRLSIQANTDLFLYLLDLFEGNQDDSP